MGGVVFSHPAADEPIVAPMDCPGVGAFRPLPCGRDNDHPAHRIGIPPARFAAPTDPDRGRRHAAQG